MLLEHTELVIETIGALKRAGIGISLDDFGTGYSSLSYLKRLPLDQLKIDQTFVRDLPSAASDVAIVRTIVALGQSLDMEVIAEGVETVAQRDALAAASLPRLPGLFVRQTAAHRPLRAGAAPGQPGQRRPPTSGDPMTIDEPTLMTVLGLASLTAGAMFAALHQVARQMPGVRLWAIGCLAIGAATMVDGPRLIDDWRLASLLFNIPVSAGQVCILA
ncbi:EAL domain-containing protein [Massilia sp. H-1]|nr:EAL domain-containing protein [Massilia sp. H-1]